MQRESWLKIGGKVGIGGEKSGRMEMDAIRAFFGGQEALIFHSQPGISFHSISPCTFYFLANSFFTLSPGKFEKGRSELSGKGIENQLKPNPSCRQYIFHINIKT